MKDYYRILGIPENASEQDVKLAYRRLAKRYHPDMNAGAKGAEEKFKEIVEAYGILSDPDLRRSYDTKRNYRSFYSNVSFTPPRAEKEKKDPRKKEYSPEELRYAREKHRRRILQHMQKRKKLLVGMIISFVLFMFGAAYFESWIDTKRAEQKHSIDSVIEAQMRKQEAARRTTIDDMDSPYDSVFGPGIYVWPTDNEIVVYNSKSDAVICVLDSAGKTIRNEFAHAGIGFIFRDMPNGRFRIKVYTGKNWNVNKKIPDGRPLGGFASDERFFLLSTGPYTLIKPTSKDPQSNCSDTVLVDPEKIPVREISKSEFYAIRTFDPVD